jgi:hypothetical protein
LGVGYEGNPSDNQVIIKNSYYHTAPAESPFLKKTICFFREMIYNNFFGIFDMSYALGKYYSLALKEEKYHAI